MKPEAIDLKKHIRCIPDWPKKGILFRDITPLLADPKALSATINAFCVGLESAKIDYVAAVEARGFIFGSAVAEKLNAGLVPVRKKGKLPAETESLTYDLEYGTNTLEVHRDAFEPPANVLMLDDLLATGGTMEAACELIEKIGGKIVAVAFLIELPELAGREKLKGYDIKVIIPC